MHVMPNDSAKIKERTWRALCNIFELFLRYEWVLSRGIGRGMGTWRLTHKLSNYDFGNENANFQCVILTSEMHHFKRKSLRSNIVKLFLSEILIS